MDYGALIREAWATTWRHRFLWVLGLFAGGAVGVAGGGGNGQGVRWQTSPQELARVAPATARAAQEVERWAGANAGLVATAAGAALALVLALVVVSLIAQGGMAEATVNLATGRPSSLALAWRAGRRLFWRYAGLALLLVGAVLAAAAAAGVLAAAALAPVVAAASIAPELAALAFVVLVPLGLAAVIAAVAASIVVAYAQRAVYAEDAGPLAALGAGWGVLRAHPGASVLTWLVNLALAFGVGIAAALAVGAVVAVLAVLGMGAWAVSEAAGVAYVILAALAVLAGGALLAAVTNTFFWNYWTLAYLRLAGRERRPAGAV
jgi:hypothetical protein